ncbi:MAG: YitT family protein [Lachnospiraceae bacterium]|nr:YitT family protein [Lachnospiraceae bacterium]
MSKILDYLKKNSRRIFMSLAGVVICAISVGVFKLAALGVDPFQSLMSGLDAMIPIKFGILYVIVNAILLIFSIIADRHNIGIATFINLFLLGFITQFTYDLLQKLIPNPSIPVRIICLIIGIVVICFGSAFYMTADLGVSTYDAVAIVMSKKWKWGKFKYVRICTDLVCVIIGCVLFVLAGNSVKMIPTIAGIGTIITAFFMGPLIDLFNKKVAEPFLNMKKKDTRATESETQSAN